MPILFASRVGNVTQFDDPAAQCTVSRPLLRVTPSMDWNQYRAIVTRVTLSQQVNVQFLHTMGSMVYVYVFGDRMGSVGLSGLSFFLCECGNEPSGQQDIYNWYKSNRASRRRDPITVSVGSAVINGYVTGFSEDVVDASLHLVQWNVSMMALPDDD